MHPRFVSIPFALAIVWTLGVAAADSAPLVMEDFRSATTEGLLKLCDSPPDDPLHQGAVGYCVGYLTGAYHHYKASVEIGSARPIVCMTGAEPSRKEAIEQFVAWAKAHPEHGNQLAVDSLFRFLGEKHPCTAGKEGR